MLNATALWYNPLLNLTGWFCFWSATVTKMKKSRAFHVSLRYCPVITVKCCLLPWMHICSFQQKNKLMTRPSNLTCGILPVNINAFNAISHNCMKKNVLITKTNCNVLTFVVLLWSTVKKKSLFQISPGPLFFRQKKLVWIFFLVTCLTH